MLRCVELPDQLAPVGAARLGVRADALERPRERPRGRPRVGQARAGALHADAVGQPEPGRDAVALCVDRLEVPDQRAGRSFVVLRDRRRQALERRHLVGGSLGESRVQASVGRRRLDGREPAAERSRAEEPPRHVGVEPLEVRGQRRITPSGLLGRAAQPAHCGKVCAVAARDRLMAAAGAGQQHDERREQRQSEQRVDEQAPAADAATL